jgi:hypothetical protein
LNIVKKEIKKNLKKQCSRNIQGVKRGRKKFKKEAEMDFSEKQLEKHEFHFVLTRTMREELERLSVFKQPKSLSGIIVRILSEFAPVIKGEHTSGRQRMSRYAFISPQPEDEREHIHIYLDEDVYRELKLVHHDLNFYSIAQIVRMFLGLFLKLVDKYGENIFQVLKKLHRRWKKKIRKNRLTLRKKLRHLFKIIQSIPGKHGLLTIYDNHFIPFWMMWF